MLLELQDRLKAMKRQEVQYMCCDYTQPPKSGPSSVRKNKPLDSLNAPDLVNLLEECAMLVMDPSLNASAFASERIQDGGDQNSDSNKKWNDRTPKSPSSVNKVNEALSLDGDNATTSSFSDCGSSSTTTTQEETSYLFHYNTNPELGYWRLQMFDWACMVVDGFHMDRFAVLATAFNLLDRFTAIELRRQPSTPISREDYHLFAMTAIYIAVKVLEPYPRKLSLETIAVMSRDFYTPKDLEHMELEMLAALQWRTTPPTAIGFCRELAQFLVVAPAGTDMEHVYSTLCDVTVSDAYFLNYTPSVISLAAILHAARLSGEPGRERALLRKQGIAILNIKADKLDQVYKKLEELYCK